MTIDDFDRPPDRRGTGSFKWDLHRNSEALPFWVADMDFASPSAVVEAVTARAAHGVYGYAYPKVSEEEAVLHYLRKRHGLRPEGSWLVWLPGLVPSLSTVAAMAEARGARSALTCTPIYPPFLQCPADGNLEALSIPLRLEESGKRGRWAFDREAMENAVRPDTGLFLLCNPHNPVGRVYARDELEWLGDFCERHDLLFCSDEVHCDLILNEEATSHVCALHLDESLRERTVVLMSASKTYNVAGIGCAFAVIPDGRLRVAFRRAMGGRVPPVNVFGYASTEAAFRQGEPWRLELLEYLRENQELLRRHFEDQHPELPVVPAEATYLAWIDLRPLGLERPGSYFQGEGLILSEGSDFGSPGFVRWNLGCSRELLQTGLERFSRAVENLRASA